MIFREDLEQMFAPPALPTAAQRYALQQIRTAAFNFAKTIIENTTPSPDQTVAVRRIREATLISQSCLSLTPRAADDTAAEQEAKVAV